MLPICELRTLILSVALKTGTAMAVAAVLSPTTCLCGYICSLDPRPNPRGRVWGKTLLGSALLECHGLWIQQTSSFRIFNAICQVILQFSTFLCSTVYSLPACHSNSNAIWLKWCSFPHQHWRQHSSAQDTSRQGFSPDPFLRVGSGVQTMVLWIYLRGLTFYSGGSCAGHAFKPVVKCPLKTCY